MRERRERGVAAVRRGRRGSSLADGNPTLSELRQQALERDGGCVWPGHFHEGPLELMHLTHRGMGGDPGVNRLDQVAIGCRAHHDILDGRTVAGRKAAVADLLAAYLGRERHR